MSMTDSKKKRFRTRYEEWALRVIFGRHPFESEGAAAFLRVNAGEAEPVTEVEKLWMGYWEGHPPPVSKLKDIYLERAQATQQPGTEYADILHAFRLASLCGSPQADAWLREQRLAPLPIKTIWNSTSKEIWDLNG